jgi:type III restriction enzyme
MKLQFDSSQQYQLDAIQSVVDLFDGQPLEKGEFEFAEAKSDKESLIRSGSGFGNFIVLAQEQIAKNLEAVQERNGIIPDKTLDLAANITGEMIPQFTLEMETGTGKTYVYLRTIYELNKTYGFKKFVIVVPSVAIREGVWKNLTITHEHFQQLYGKPLVNMELYDSKRISALRNYMASNAIQILVINIDSFSKDENVINQQRDNTLGKRPIEFIQAARPFVIVDEPQNMETEIRKKAILNLNPCCILRYSATHKNPYNMVYRLDPVKSYDLGLVKQIVVDSVFTKFSSNMAYIHVKEIKAAKSKVTASLEIEVNGDNGWKLKTVAVDKKNYDLFDLSNQREAYRGLQVGSANVEDGYIEFSTGERLYKGQTQGGFTDEVMKAQIRDTILEHLDKERKLKSKGIKVLSLFFIDRVANYKVNKEGGQHEKGKFAVWFEEIYTELTKKEEYQGVIPFNASEVHDGYFSGDSKGNLRDTSGETAVDHSTYALIMREKEKLLDAKVPLRFIFSHSALREGWDNPNVFQICTLNETRSYLKKRQEIGRGLRLCVDSDGNRVFDKNVNVLTVIANESYEQFAKQLQQEIQDDCNVSFEGRIKDARNRKTITIRKGFELDERFLDIWNRIRYRTKYRVSYDTRELIRAAAKAVAEMPEVLRPQIVSEKSKVNISTKGVTTEQTRFGVLPVQYHKVAIPDILGYIQGKTELTRSTLMSILRESGRMNQVMVNPQMFLDHAVLAIRGVLNELMVDGITYDRVSGSDSEFYFMELFTDEFESFKNYLPVRNPDKTLYNEIEFESGTEKEFAHKCDLNPDVEFFFKLPRAFYIETPIGRYSPDWALIFKNESRIYFVAETKFDLHSLRPDERMKIKCGKAHFEGFEKEGVVYKAVSGFEELL